MKFPLATLLLSAASVLAVKPSPGCGSTPKTITPAAATTPLRLTINSRARQFYAKLPASYNSSVPHRLVFTIHALGGNAQQVASGTGIYLPWYGLASLSASDSVPTVFISPNGVDAGWGNDDGEDVAFFRAMIDLAGSDLCIDENLRFATGFSYGASMSNTLSCALPRGVLRGIAVLSGSPLLSGGCAASGEGNSLGLYIQHGLRDALLPIRGAREIRDRMVKNNGCTAVTPKEPASGSGRHIKTEYTGCREGFPVTYLAFDGSHTPTPKDAGASETFSAVETWNFFKQFR